MKWVSLGSKKSEYLNDEKSLEEDLLKCGWKKEEELNERNN
jgi:hypothetical protein